MTNAVDVAVVGGGAAGIAAARSVAAAGASVLVLEARERLGGRAHTVEAGGFPVDLGCGWLHSAERNAWAAIAEDLGLTVDRSPAPWMRQAYAVGFPPDEQRAFRAAFAAFEDRVEKAAEEPDRPASSLFEPGGRWNALLDAFSGYYNGEGFDRISIHDYAAFDDEGSNWRVREGYGRAVGLFARDLPAALGTPVTRIDWSGPTLKLVTPAGVLEARAAVVAVPTAVLEQGRLAFDPPLPDKAEAAAALPLGHVEKAFLALSDPRAFEPDMHLFGRTDTARAASYHLRPFGRPLIECFFGGALARELAPAGPPGFAAFAVDELVSLLGSDFRAQLTPLTASAWTGDPWTGGAYSHARPGRRAARAALAAPVAERLFFAGEACSPHAYSTAHGAYQTGLAAAEAAVAALRRG